MNVLISEEESINNNNNNNNNNSINLNVNNINKSNELNLIFRNQLSEDTHITLDLNISKSIFDIKKILYEKLDIKETSNEIIKLFFKGRPLRDDEQLKFLNFSQNDVILYMIITNKPTFQNIENNNNINSNNSNNNNDGILSINEEEINRSINEINRRNNLLLLQRGFNIFLNYGVSEEELHVIRLLFHYTLFQQYRRRGLNMDWSNEAMLEREERWLRNYTNNINENVIRNRIYENRRFNNNIILIRRRRNYFNRNRNDIYFSDNYYEPNYCFIQGFVIGFLLNIFTLLCLILCKFRRKFRLGLQMGMLISICIFILPLSNN
jgi:hypothetical protein